MFASSRDFFLSLLPWQPTFSGRALGFLALYVLAQTLFCLLLRRKAMAIPGPQRMCSPLGLWALVIPGVGAFASFGLLRHVWDAATAAADSHHIAPPRSVARAFAIVYGLSRLLMLWPGMQLPALTIQLAAAVGFLMQLDMVARSLRTPDVAVA